MTRTFKEKSVTTVTRVVDTATCNRCGTVFEDEHENSDHVAHVEFSGGPTSDVLSDCTTYEFDLCEQCIVDIVQTFKTPPTLTDYVDRREELETWGHDRAAHARQRADEEKSNAEYAEAKQAGRCIHREPRHGAPLCGAAAVLVSDGDWPYCELHGVDNYSMDCTIVRDGALSPYEARAAIGRACREAFMRGSALEYFRVGAGDIIRQSTLIAMLGDRATARPASRLLWGDWEPPSKGEWVSSRLPMRFGPNDTELAVKVNDLLFEAQLRGYRNAVALAILGRADELWREGLRSDG